jgi:hypothetical protein
MGEVQGDALLVAVEIEVEAALFGMGFVAGEGAAGTGEVALGLFHLDDLCPHISQEFSGIGR